VSASLSCCGEPLVARPRLAFVRVLAVLAAEVGFGKEGFLIDSSEDLAGETWNKQVAFELEVKV
jgi:hypothetical protein